MTALAQKREIPTRDGKQFSRPVAAATVIYAGALVCLNAAGNAVPGSTSTTLVVDGIAEDTIDNSGGSAGDVNVPVYRPGLARFANSTSTDEITAAEIGDNCYIVDDQTVAKTNGTSTRSVAGKVEDVDAQGVWVRLD
ncbi:hypothetical protein [Sphingorhabdus sp. 109]|uniref:hypothetical protein n=1 Tax=Sphingorhabdus sp. 109 TaxID=2653173 RepID=UPI0012F32B1D|nr:hypothetical protein [Sphingorhabdus sp. 109]VWX62578.1 conserved hypothetical protein [Sphingorhabdus sp. 109]